MGTLTKLITIGALLIPVVSKLLESVLLKCCEDKLVVDDLQYGFRSKVGCADAIFTMRQVVDHFTSRGEGAIKSAVYEYFWSNVRLFE